LAAQEIRVETLSSPELKNPILICGLPGSGYVGKLAVDYIIDKLGGAPFVNIYSSSFPPQVSIQPDGTVDLVKNSFFHCKTEKNDLVIVTGDAQPVSAPAEYALANEILNVCKKLHIQKVYTLAAYITGTFSKTPKVYGTSTSPQIIKELKNHGAYSMNKGSITGMNGVIIGIAKKTDLLGICLLGETSGYVIDAVASNAVLEVLCKMLDFKLDMTELKQRAEDTKQIIKSIEAQTASQSNMSQPMYLPPQEEKKLDYIS